MSRRVAVFVTVTALLALPATSVAATAPATAPGAGLETTVRFAVIGDMGTGTSEQAEVAERMCSWRADHPYGLVVTTGDNVYPSGHPDDFPANFFEPYSCLFDAEVKFRASLGNHDVVTENGQPELDEPLFGIRRRNYVVTYQGIRFVIANSNNLDKTWLEKRLPAGEGDRWTIVVFHHPVYSPGTGHGSTPGFRPGLPKLFREHGVDLVLNGHDHIFSATKELKRIRYVVTGGGGASPYGCRETWYSEKCVARNHFLIVRATDEKLYVSAIPRKGKPFFRFSTVGR